MSVPPPSDDLVKLLQDHGLEDQEIMVYNQEPEISTLDEFAEVADSEETFRKNVGDLAGFKSGRYAKLKRAWIAQHDKSN